MWRNPRPRPPEPRALVSSRRWSLPPAELPIAPGDPEKSGVSQSKNGLPALSGPGRFGTAIKTEFNSEPIRLTFDAGKAAMGTKYSHFVDIWAAYRYWPNKFGLDRNAMPGVCTIAATGASTWPKRERHFSDATDRAGHHA
jgi:hypothetical protein